MSGGGELFFQTQDGKQCITEKQQAGLGGTIRLGSSAGQGRGSPSPAQEFQSVFTLTGMPSPVVSAPPVLV